MSSQQTPDQALNAFYRSLREFHFQHSWNLFSNKTQQEFLRWTLDDIYRRHRHAATTVKLGLPEVKLMFEGNDPSLQQTFWRRFVVRSAAGDFTQFAYFATLENNGKQAKVQARLAYPDGRTNLIDLVALFERGGWKYAYIESGLPWK